MSTIPKPGTSVSSDEFDNQEDQDELNREFESASDHLRTLADTADQNTLLYLYARYKQATDGRCSTPKPGLFEFRAKQKWEAWKSLGDLDRRVAMEQYVRKIKELDPKWTFGQIGAKSGGKSGGFGVGVSRPMMDESDQCGDRIDPVWLEAVKEGRLEILKALSSAMPSQFEILTRPDENGLTALHWAADRGRAEIAQWLTADANLDVNARDSNGQTPLHYAYLCGYQDVICILLDAGADASIVDNDGNTPAELSDDS